MSDEYDDADNAGRWSARTDPDEPAYEPGGRRRGERRSSVPGCLAVLVALAVRRRRPLLRRHQGRRRDQGPVRLGRRTTPARAPAGHLRGRRAATPPPTSAATSRTAGVVASVEAFIDAATANPDSRQIQVGFYELKKEMAADDASRSSSNPDNLVKATVTIPEGLRVVDIVAILAEKTDFSKKAFAEGPRQARPARAARLRRRQPRGLPLPGDLRLPAGRDAEGHAHRDGRPLAAGRRRRGPRGRRRARWATPRPS